MANIVIDVAAEFTGKKAFDKAAKSTVNLEKSVKSLGRTLGLTLSATAVLAYSKASVKAAAADQKAQQQLALALKNVGLGRDAATAEGYIQRIEKEFGIIDDKLRPAYSALTIATRDTAETQRILGIALDVSANTGKDFNAVVAALSKAYLGNNTALSKLGVGISKADLKVKSFQEISEQLAVTFAGSAQKSADSFSGSIDKLAIASNNAKEIIGTSLIGALQSLSKDSTMTDLASGIESAAKSLANFVDSIVYLKDQIKSIPGFGLVTFLGSGVTDLLGRFSPQRLAELIKGIKGFQGMGNVSMTGGSNVDTQKADTLAKARAAKGIADAKSIAAAKAKADKLAAAAKIKADKNAADNAAKLSKASAMFDLDKIQIEAALKGKITDEETLRLQLQRAILNEDATLADALQKKLEASQRATAALQGQISGIKPPVDPFAETLESLKGIAELLGKISGFSFVDPGRKGGGILALEPDDLAPLVPKKDAVPKVIIEEKVPVVIEELPKIPATNGSMAGLGGNNLNNSNFGFSVPGYIYQPSPVTVNVTVGGSVVAEQELVKVVADALVVANTQGLNVSRPGGLGFRADEG